MFFGRNASKEPVAPSSTEAFLQRLLERLRKIGDPNKQRKAIEQLLKSPETAKSPQLVAHYLLVESSVAAAGTNPLEDRRKLRQEVRDTFPELLLDPELALVTQDLSPTIHTARVVLPSLSANSGELFKDVLEAINEGIIAMREDGVIIMVNPAVSKIWGHSREELVGQSFVSLLPEEIRESYGTGLNRFLGVPLELEGVRNNGQRFPIGVNISRAEHNGEPVLTVSVQDITMRKYIEDDLVHTKDELEDRVADRTKDLLETQKDLEDRARELERTNTELQQFAYVASHDLQEPLRSITSFIQILSRRHGDELGTEAKEYMGFVVDGAKRMQDLINELLEYSRAGRVDRDFQKVDLNQIVSRVRSNLHATIEESGAQLEVQHLPTLPADDRQMIQLFQNLIENGIKFHGEDPPKITIECQDRITHWEFSVSDNGIGIEKKYKDRIFIIFQRLHTRDNYPGNGIGLAICKKIVERHGGFISLDVEHSPGTRFVFGLAKETT